MKKIVSIIIVCCITQVCFSQADSTAPVYLRFPTIPQFTIYKAIDSSAFTREDLKKKTSTVFMIFNPECEHCQRETDSIITHIDKFKDAQIVMISYLSFDEMKKFYSDYKIADYPLITMGRDAKFFFPVFFKVQNLPSIYVYDKKGNFKKAFEGSVRVDKIAAEL